MNKICIFMTISGIAIRQCCALTMLHPSQIVPQLHSTKASSEHTMLVSLPYLRSRIPSALYAQNGEDKNDEMYDDDDELSQMKNEIEQLKKEAALRIDALSNQIVSSPSSSSSPIAVTEITEDDSSKSSLSVNSSEDSTEIRTQTAVSNAVRPATIKNGKQKRDDMDLLEETQWKMVLNIGREPGTWMPKTWGVSGERLRANLEIQFTPNQLYEREEFLGGVGGAKQCHIVDNSITLGPSITEGQRKIPVKKGPAAGGWRIAKGTGPLGTDMLRFYIDIDDQMSHSGSDVYCPKGRIYMQCGLFELNNNDVEFGGRREQLKAQLTAVTNKYEDLNEKIEKEGFFSLEKVKLTRDLFQVSMDARMINAKLNDARVIEPDRSILSISKDGGLGLTREGGVVCKVMKGAVMEYHILGRFALVAMDRKKDEEYEKEKVH